MITVHFACGHALSLPDDTQKRPTCPQDGDTRIVRTDAPAPTFRGLCAGPTATKMETIDPYQGRLSAGERE